MKRTKCECGCGDYAKEGRRFIHGHNERGKKRSKETREKISKTKMGHECSIKTRKKMSKTQTGIKHSEKTKKKIGDYNRGKKRSVEARINMSIAQAKPEKNSYCDAWKDKEYVNDLRKSACENCGITNTMNYKLFGCKLNAHHKNGNQECAPKDIQTLCHSCHIKMHHFINRHLKEELKCPEL